MSPAPTARGRVTVPGDKSVSHRALLLSALAHGETRVSGLGMGGDVRSTRRVLTALGVEIRDEGEDVVVVGCGWEGLRAPAEPLDCGNSGTTLRVMMGILASTSFESTLTGDASLSSRPMERVAAPLRRMGATIETTAGKPPVRVLGGPLHGIDFESPVASAQVKTAVLLAGLRASGTTRVTEPERSRDHTERFFAAMGVPMTISGNAVTVDAGPLRALARFTVPGDLSSAAFWLAAGLLRPSHVARDGGDDGVVVLNALVNPTRTGFLEAVALMGGEIRVHPVSGGVEPTADLEARYGPLRGADLPPDVVVRAIDEVPILAVLATQAVGRTRITGAAELRVKECDRLAVMAETLTALGATVRELPDGLEIDGPTPLRGGRVDSHHDHRIAMSAAIAALCASGPVTIDRADAAAVSYPEFWETLDSVCGNPGLSV
ncbi:MAG: 3-phosphoshikimate 1-carboxyvinyltransferase [Myxococcales bacterium]|nr:3-phosphoshikimate 1-carboxyvinyltransferase [Myxococcales bacterium]